MREPRKYMMVLALAGLFLGGIGPMAFAQRVIYVDASAARGSDNGASWSNAYTDLQDALAATGEPGACTAELPCEVWVAAGVYTPDRGTRDRTATFEMRSHLGIYGGFAGWEAFRSLRNWTANETILSGDLNGDDGPDDCAEHSNCCVEHEGLGCDDVLCEQLVCEEASDCCDSPYNYWHERCVMYAEHLCCHLSRRNNCENSLHVVTAIGTDPSAVLDGFTITGGYANISDYSRYGAGLYNREGSITIRNCMFSENLARGGAGALTADSPSATFSNCLFIGNQAGQSRGGGLRSSSSQLTLTDCLFLDNFSGIGGGGLSSRADSTLVNCAFIGNAGGGMYSYGDAVLVDCAFIENSNWGGLRFTNGYLVLDGCSFIGNTGGWGAGVDIDGIYVAAFLRRCVFTDNRPHAISTGIASVALVDCLITGNTGNTHSGAMYVDASSLTMTNCTVSGNTAGLYCGGLCLTIHSEALLTNCILWGNRGTTYDTSEDAQIILWADSTLTINNSIVQGWTGQYGGVGNSGDDPLFVRNGWWEDPGTPEEFLDDIWHEGDYHLQPDSPAIDAGDSYAPYIQDTDLDGHARVLCDGVDLGPYEFGIGDDNCNGIVDLTDFSRWQHCLNGPDAPSHHPFGCAAFDFDGDENIDLADFAGFQNVLPTAGP